MPTLNTPTSLGDSVAFYSHFSEKLLFDYAYGNPRMEAAIQHALHWIPREAQRILDVGCGVGWSSWEMKRHVPNAVIHGVDLSTPSINATRRLFGSSSLTFSVRDIINGDNSSDLPYDAILMLDVYEHIPKYLRSQLHTELSNLLEKHGRVILSCPSAQQLGQMRAKGESLQPVDEDVTEEDACRFAADIGGRLIRFDYVSIWNPNDYFHALIGRGNAETDLGQDHDWEPPSLEAQPMRANRVSDRLGVRFLNDGLIVSDRGDATVCVVAPERNAYSETFIKAHIGHLPAKILPLYGYGVSTLHDERGPLIPPFTLRRHLRESLARRLRQLEWEDFQRAYVRKFLRDNDVDAVLAEYGPTGVMMMEICRDERIPLIVHFHGYDAHNKDTLRTYGSHYPQLFSISAAIVAVSIEMIDELVSLGAQREKIHYCPCGVDLERFPQAAPDKAPPHFIGVGRFVTSKGHYLSLLAFKSVLTVVPQARLTIVGDGPLWESCKLLAGALGIDSSVDLPGRQQHYQVAALMQQARALIHHSVRAISGDSEGTPLAILEAGAAGLPVIASRVGGISDVIVDNETGLLVDEGDVEGMATYMIRLANEPDLAIKLGRAGRKRVTSKFSMERSISNLWKIIESAIEESRDINARR